MPSMDAVYMRIGYHIRFSSIPFCSYIPFYFLSFSIHHFVQVFIHHIYNVGEMWKSIQNEKFSEEMMMVQIHFMYEIAQT